jgi:hypothetical protein
VDTPPASKRRSPLAGATSALDGTGIPGDRLPAWRIQELGVPLGSRSTAPSTAQLRGVAGAFSRSEKKILGDAAPHPRSATGSRPVSRRNRDRKSKQARTHRRRSCCLLVRRGKEQALPPGRPSHFHKQRPPGLIQLFLRFLDAAGVSRDRLIYRVTIHESADVAAAQRFWLGLTGADLGQFRRPTLKRHNPKTVRKNIGDNYRGCLRVNVRCSSGLYRQIEGWARAAMNDPSTVTERLPPE